MGHSLFILLILSMTMMSFGVKVIYEWKYAEYEWENPKHKRRAIESGTYNPYEAIMHDVEKANDGRVFVAVPKILGPGVPATLAIVTNKTGPGGPLLRPYPNWSWYNSSCMCDNIISTYQVHIRCNHLFVLDNGKGPDQIYNPKLLIFDLEDDTLVKTIYIPLDIATNQTGSGTLVAPFVYFPGKCTKFLDKMIVFMADSGGSGLVVYDLSRRRMCRVESDYMKPTDTFISIAGENFTYEGGIMGMTILDDDLYYAPVSGKEIYKMNVKTLLKCPNKKRANKQTKLLIKVSSQIPELTSTEHSIFYSPTREMSILGTNVCNGSGNNTVVLAQDNEKFQSVSSVKASTYWGKLMGLSDRYQRFALGTARLDEIHFRIFEMDLKKIQKIMGELY